VSLLLENLDAPASQACLDVPVSQARLVPEPLDVGSLVQAHKIGTDVDGSSLGAIVLSKLDCSPAIQKAFSLPWEEDLLTSPWEEVSGSGVAATVKASVLEASLAKAVRSSSQALSLIQWGFFGLRTVSPSSLGVKEVSLSSKGKDPLQENDLLRRWFLGSNSASSSLLEMSFK
jgi:hypothetical protein